MQGQNKRNVRKLALTYAEYESRGRTLQNLLIDQYRIAHYLDYGSESEVYLANNIKTEQEVAVKLINLKEINDQVNRRVREISLRCVQNQIMVMSQLDSPYLLKCYQTYENQDFKLLIIEYCSGITLQGYIQKKHRILEGQAFEIVSDLIQGLKVLHQNFIVLRDLKADNIITKDGVFKIANFHFSEKLSITHQDEEINGPCMGSLKLMPPEMISRKPYGLKIDIWSLGILFFQMIYSSYPFVSDSMSQFYQEIIKNNYFSKEQAPDIHGYKASGTAFQFLKLTLSIQTKKRSNIQQLYLFLRKNVFLEDEKSSDKESLIASNLKPERLKLTQQCVLKFQQKNIHQIKKQCQKVNFIINQLLNPLISCKKPFMKKRQIAQFLFLLNARCLVIINGAEICFNRHINIYKNTPEFKAVKDNIASLNKQIQKNFSQSSNQLTEIENKVLSMIADWLRKKTKKTDYDEKQKFFVGIEVLQYTKDQQVEFTIQHFKKKVQSHLLNQPQLKSVAIKMRTYRQNILNYKPMIENTTESCIFSQQHQI